MGMLDFLSQTDPGAYGGLLNMPAGGVFPPVTAPTSGDDADAAQQARDAAAIELARKMKGSRTGPFKTPDTDAPAVQYALGNIPNSIPPFADTTPLSAAEQKMMALVGGGQPLPAANAPFGALAPVAAQPVAPPNVAAVVQRPGVAPPRQQAEAPVTAAAPPPVDPAALPENAQATVGQTVAAPAAEPSLLSRIGDKLNQNSNLLIGMGAGFAGAPSIGTGISRALTGASAGSQLDIKQAMQQGAIGPTYTALVKAGVPKEQALAAVYNPEIMKSVTQSYITDRGKSVQIIKDALGGEHAYELNKYPKDGEPVLKPIDPDGGTAAAGTAGGGAPQLLAPGVGKYDPTKSGEEYFNQFSPEVQAAAKAYMKGDVMPTGNARMQSIANFAKTVAQKYGNDIGVPVSDNLYAEKHKYRTELGSNSPATVGGQAKAFNQGIDHLSHLAENLEKLDNSNGLGIPVIAQGVNAVRQGVSNDQAAIADEAKSLGQTVAGEVGKLFSGSAGGGVHEREMTRERFDTVKSRPQLAAALRATIETMHGGLAALEQNRDRVLGPNSGVDFVGEETKAKIAKIQDTIDRLEGRAPGASRTAGTAAPAAPVPVASKADYDALPSGRTYTAPDGSVRTKQ